jgi:predicted PurR-regulated permease PerM
MDEALDSGQFARLEQAWNWLQTRTFGIEGLDLAGYMKQGMNRLAALAASEVGHVLQGVALLIFRLILMLFATFFLLRDGHVFVEKLQNALPFERGKREDIVAQTRDLIYASVSSSLIVAAVQGALGGMLFAILGLGAPVFWGVVMAFFALLPMLGPWVVWVPAAIWLLAIGSYAKALILLGVGFGVVGLVDNVLRPYLLSGRSQMNGLLVFISLLGGIGVFGFIGLILGPIVMATAASLFDAYTQPE